MNPCETSEPLAVLVVDDHRAARESVADVLRSTGYLVDGAASATEALKILDRAAYHVIITDLQMPGMDGLEFMRQLRERRLATQVIMVTAHATIASAVEAMRHGAFDYLEKPFNVTQLEDIVSRAVERGRLLIPAGSSTSTDSETDEKLGLIGDSVAMSNLRCKIQQVARTDETVLICGESGTGKELVARALHESSHRSLGPLVSLNCPALSPQLTESELFGHRRGAFTGADEERTGRFELANAGTILLDEITEIDLSLQAKLLRVLQERTFERVGCSVARTADVRVLASTNRNLQREVAEGRFRQDLYYRLAVVPLELPPLRERGDDVQLLADHFLSRASERLGRPRCILNGNARNLFAAYHWPGNVRELENIITRACVLNAGEQITSAELRPWLEQPNDVCTDCSSSQNMSVGTTLEDVERQMILATLSQFDGHRARTAEALGIGVRTLSGKLRSYGVAPHAKGIEPPSRQNLPTGSAKDATQWSRQVA